VRFIFEGLHLVLLRRHLFIFCLTFEPGGAGSRLPPPVPYLAVSHAFGASVSSILCCTGGKTVLLKDGTEVADEVETIDEFMHTGPDGLTTQGARVQRLPVYWDLGAGPAFVLVFVGVWAARSLLLESGSLSCLMLGLFLKKKLNLIALPRPPLPPISLARARVLVGCCLAEVSERLALFGRNELVSKRTPKWKILVSKFQGPMPYMVSGARPVRVCVCV
jgi:hypothetical protein